jgi:TonB family protein
MPPLLIFLVLAADTATPSGAPHDQAARIVDVTDQPPLLVERNGVRWGERMSSFEDEDCGKPKVKCRLHEIDVSNYSDSFLRCHGTIQFSQPNRGHIPDADRTLIVPANKSWRLVSAKVPREMNPKSHEVECTPEPQLPPLDLPAECKLKVTGAMDMAEYFPAAAIHADHEGPVYVEFMLAAAEGTPTDIQVIQSSTYPELDAAAVRMFGAMAMTTNCPGKHYRLLTMFKIP